MPAATATATRPVSSSRREYARSSAAGCCRGVGTRRAGSSGRGRVVLGPRVARRAACGAAALPGRRRGSVARRPSRPRPGRRPSRPTPARSGRLGGGPVGGSARSQRRSAVGGRCGRQRCGGSCVGPATPARPAACRPRQLCRPGQLRPARRRPGSCRAGRPGGRWCGPRSSTARGRVGGGAAARGVSSVRAGPASGSAPHVGPTRGSATGPGARRRHSSTAPTRSASSTSAAADPPQQRGPGLSGRRPARSPWRPPAPSRSATTVCPATVIDTRTVAGSVDGRGNVSTNRLRSADATRSNGRSVAGPGGRPRRPRRSPPPRPTSSAGRRRWSTTASTTPAWASRRPSCAAGSPPASAAPV